MKTCSVLAVVAILSFSQISALGDPGDIPFRGVHYHLPVDEAQAAADFSAIRSTGANTIFTGVVHSEHLLAMADSMGLKLFMQLPLFELPVKHLPHAVNSVMDLVTAVARASGSHPSVQYLGLGYRPDTSEPEACRVLSELATTVRQQSEGRLSVFYVTGFIEHDQCASVADLVLIEQPDEGDVSLLERWRAVHQTPVGLASVGAWVDDGKTEGFRTAHSREYQARELENQLGAAFSGDYGDLPALFVDRWRDREVDYVDLSGDVTRPFVRASGLHDMDGNARPALEVMRGFFLGEQTVFAFPAGGSVFPEGAVGFRWLVWVLVALLAMVIRSSPNMRDLTRRYFRAHGIYLETVRFGRNLDPGQHLAGLLALSLGAGVISGILLDVVKDHPAFNVLIRQFSNVPLQGVIAAVQSPVVLLVAIGTVYALVMVSWILLLTVISGIRSRHSVVQRLALVIWPRWTLLLVLFAAVVIDTFDDPVRQNALLVLAAAWLVLAFWSVIRMTSDCLRALGGRYLLAFVLAVGVPLVVSAGLAFLLAQGSGLPYLEYAWHLITRT